MRTPKISNKLAVFCLISVVCLASVWQLGSEIKLNRLLAHPTRLNSRLRTPQQKSVWLRQNNQLAQLWLGRTRRDVTPDLLALLQTSRDEDINRRTVRALGRIENPKSLPPLQAWQKKLSAAQRRALSPTLNLALARIRGGDLTGQAKLNIVAGSMNLSWPEVERLSKKISSADTENTPANEVVDEVVDVLYQMGSQNQNTKLLVRKLTLSPAQRVLIDAGVLPEKNRADVFLDHLSQVAIEGADDSDLANKYLLPLPNSAERVVSWLQKFQRDPQRYFKRRNPKTPRIGYGLILRMASEIPDKRVAPLLRQIEADFEPAWNKNPNPNASPEAGVYFFASQASDWARHQQKKRQAPLFP